MEIAIVLCSVFLVALPAIAADQSAQKVTTTASEDDFVLGIYGNANEDDTIDMRDVTYTKLVIFGKKPETELADAFYDGEVDVLDVVQIKLIILGRESELTVVDEVDRVVTVSKPIERLVCTLAHHIEALRILEVSKDIMVGVPSSLDPDFFPEFGDVIGVGYIGHCGGSVAAVKGYPKSSSSSWLELADVRLELKENGNILSAYARGPVIYDITMPEHPIMFGYEGNISLIYWWDRYSAVKWVKTYPC